MKERITNFLGKTLLTKTGKNSLITFFSIVVNTGFSAGFFIILARFLGPANLGLFSVALALMLTISGVLDFGTNFGILRFAPKSAGQEKTKDLLSYLKLGLLTKIVLGTLGTILLAIFAHPLSVFLFHRPELGDLFLLSSLGVLGGILFGYGSAATQAIQRFFVWGALQAGSSAFRFLILVILISLSILSPGTALLAYIAMLFSVFFFSLPFLPKKIFSAKINSVHLGEFFRYNRWMALYTVLTTISLSFDRFFLARFSGPSEVGFYVAAMQIAGVGVQVYTALGTVLIPRFASLTSLDSISIYLKKSVLLTSAMALGGALVALISGPLTLLIFGNTYAHSIVPLRLLIIGVACIMASLPFTSVWLYSLGKAKDFAIYFIFNAALLFLLNWLLVPTLGAVGSAIASLSGNALTLVVSIIYVRINLTKSFSQ